MNCPKCGKSDMVFTKVVPGTAGDRIVYDCDRCDIEVHSEPFQDGVTTPEKEVIFFDNKGQIWATIRDGESALNMWSQGLWDMRINSVWYTKGTWQGREAIEKLFGVIHQPLTDM